MLTDSDGLGGWGRDETRRAALSSSSHLEEQGDGKALVSRVEGRGGRTRQGQSGGVALWGVSVGCEGSVSSDR